MWSTGIAPENGLTDSIIDWLTLKGFALLNTKGEITHHQRHGNENSSVIDLTFIKGEALSSGIINEWSVG
jgi:hypothetical protein